MPTEKGKLQLEQKFQKHQHMPLILIELKAACIKAHLPYELRGLVPLYLKTPMQNEKFCFEK